MLALVGWICYVSAGFRFAIIMLLFVTVVPEFRSQRRLRALAAARPNENIGTFARGFDRHDPAFDPWVVRAIWDALQPYVFIRSGAPALRATDRLEETLNIDPEDVWDVVLAEAARRAGRSLSSIVSNPMYGKVVTVGDLARLLSLQPKQKSA
jgi:hypothetical protein